MITPTIMMIEVPPNPTEAPAKPFAKIGIIETIIRPIAPIKIM